MTNTWFLLLPAILILISVVMTCLCWGKRRQKSDWVGLDGMVTQKNPDENVNHLPSVTIHSEPDNLTIISNNADSRNPAPNTTKRSLPDIPFEGPLKIEGGAVIYEVNGDNSSELYATVEPYTSKRLPNGIESRTSISQHSSISQADDAFSPYARVNYDKLRLQEHPYACVKSSTTEEIEAENSSDEAASSTNLLHPDRATTSQINEPIPPPRSRRSSDQSLAIDITAATAVAGAIPANQELPYMTPPIAQSNFSGDSQDSSKGYTSISVREPLANIRAQTKDIKKSLRDLDPHYSTVSDDSDEVYTTIQDPNNQLYTSGSETYAQIQPLTVAAEINPIPQEIATASDDTDSAPQPPSVDSLKNVAHSRQASSSSVIVNIGSPKPEKRQANSPLPPPPPPPSGSPDLYATPEKPHPKNLDDMYAKVQKNRKKSVEEPTPLDTTAKKTPRNSYVPQITKPVDCSSKDHNYETLNKSFHKSCEPGYEKLRPKDDECNSEPGYASINGPESLLSSDPGYEVLKQRSEAPSETDPNYEELHHTNSSKIEEASSSNTPSDGYSTINKHGKSDDKSRTSNSFDSELRDSSLEEPNYESMPSESLSDPNYSTLKSTESESDPNYESVNHDNYESVKYADPPYERLNDDDANKTDKQYDTEVPGYETIKRDLIEPHYQQIKDNTESNVTKHKTIKANENDSDDDIVIQV